jgi:hypothetical protein
VAASRTGRRRQHVGYNMTIRRFAVLSLIAPVLAMMSAPASAAAPYLTVTPTAGPGGTVVTVAGAGFCPPPCSGVEVDFGGIPVGRQVRVNGAGRFSLTFAIRATAAGGPNAIYADQRDASGTDRTASTTFRITPSTRTTKTIARPVTTPARRASTSTSPRPRTSGSSPAASTPPVPVSGTPPDTSASTAAPTATGTSTGAEQGVRASQDSTLSPWWWVAAVVAIAALGSLGYALWRRRTP